MSTLPFLWNVFTSYRYGRVVTVDDPWGFGNSLEWATSCPPPRHNFTELPRIRSERLAFELHYPHLVPRYRAEAHVRRRPAPSERAAEQLEEPRSHRRRMLSMLSMLASRGHRIETRRHLPQRGLAEHRAALLDRSRARYVLFCDDDVWLEPGTVARLHEAIVALRCGVVGGRGAGCVQKNGDLSRWARSPLDCGRAHPSSVATVVGMRRAASSSDSPARSATRCANSSGPIRRDRPSASRPRCSGGCRATGRRAARSSESPAAMRSARVSSTASVNDGRHERRQIQQRCVMPSELGADVGVLVGANRLTQRGEHGPGVPLGGERVGALPLGDAAQELLRREALRRSGRPWSGTARGPWGSSSRVTAGR